MHLISIRYSPDKPAFRMGDEPSMDFDAQRAARAYEKGSAQIRAAHDELLSAARAAFGPASAATQHKDRAASYVRRQEWDAVNMMKNAATLAEGTGAVRLPVCEVSLLLQLESSCYVGVLLAGLERMGPAMPAPPRTLPVPPMKDEVYRSASAPKMPSARRWGVAVFLGAAWVFGCAWAAKTFCGC